jgi:mannose-6-phosphate isomerase-like protein (cupin superfamily)
MTWTHHRAACRTAASLGSDSRNGLVDTTRPPCAGLPGIDHVALAGSVQGLNRLSVWRQPIAPGSATPPHRHDCGEVVPILAGYGALYIRGRQYPIGPRTTAVVGPDAVHPIVDAGDVHIDTVGIFSVVAVCLPEGGPRALPWAWSPQVYPPAQGVCAAPGFTWAGSAAIRTRQFRGLGWHGQRSASSSGAATILPVACAAGCL